MSNYTTAATTADPADPGIRDALAGGGLIDITTTGRRTGEPRRIEIVLHDIDGRLFISGMPRRATRAWLHNLRADPRMIVHLKGSVVADIPATAREVTDETERMAVFTWITTHAWPQQQPEAMLRYSPLIEVIPDVAPA